MATYKIKTKRFLRKYSAAEKLPVSAALIDAQRVVDELCNVPWQEVAPTESVVTSHDESKLDENVANRDLFDAALFCAEHANGDHRAFANAACYKIPLPAGTSANLTGLKVRVTSDAYNAHGARIALVTNSTGVIPTDCATCRGEGGIHAAGVAPQTIQTVDGRRYGYPTIADCVFSDDPGDGEYALPSGGLALGSCLYVFVLLENYNSVRGNWLEGSSCLKNLIELTTDAAIPGWTDGDTIDLTVQETTRTFKVVSGGVYPDNLSGLSGVETIQLQRTGDELASKLTPTESVGNNGLFLLSAGVMSSLLNIPAEKITYVGNHMVQRTNGRIDENIIVIAGNFDGGTIREFPGIYFYDAGKMSFFPEVSVDGLDESLATFARDHGGFGCVSIFSDAYDADRGFVTTFTNTNGLSVIGKDGTYNAHLSGTYPVLFFQVDADDNITTKTSVSPAIHYANVSTRISALSVEVFGYQLYNWMMPTHTTGRVLNMGYNNRICVFDREANAIYIATDNLRTYQDTVYHLESSLQFATSAIQIVGEVTGINAGTFRPISGGAIYDFVITGRLTSVGGTPCSSIAFVNGGGAYAPNYSSSLTPDRVDNFKMSAGFSSFVQPSGSSPYRGDVPNLIVSGDFKSLGGDSRFSGLAALNIMTGALSPVSHPDYGRTATAFDMRSQYGSIMIAAVPNVSPSVIYYDHLHPSVTDAQSAIGLRTLFAKLYSGSLGAVSLPTVSPDGARLGAQFVVRSDTISVPVLVDGEPDTEDVPTWQLSLVKLIVPFSLPTSFTPTRLKLDWSQLSAATTGSKLLVWMRDAYVSTYPDIRNPAIYDGSQAEVDGWKLLGVVDPSLTTVTLPIAPTGRFASLLFAAGLNMDDVNPASGMASPVGVGTANLNGVAGTVSGLNTGWKPDITLLG